MTTRALAEFTASITPDALPVEVRRQAARLVLDALGCAMAAWTEDAEKSRIARDIAALYPGAPGAHVMGTKGAAVQPAFAALANGIPICWIMTTRI